MKRLFFAMCTFIALGATACANAQNPAFISPDLFMEELRGNVAKVEYLNEYGGIESEKTFDQKGYMILPDYEVKRDAQGRIVEVSTPDDAFYYYSETYTYDAKGWPTGLTFEGDDSEGSVKFFYDNTGTVVRKESVSESYDGAWSSTYEYTILARDNMGNWTKRRVRLTEKVDGEVSSQSTMEQTRKITYR